MAIGTGELNYQLLHISGMLEIYLRGKKTLGWAISMISEDLRGEPLAKILSDLKEVGDEERYQELRRFCQERNWVK